MSAATPTRSKKDLIFDALDADPDATNEALAELAGCDIGHAQREAKKWRTARAAGVVQDVPTESILLDLPTQMRPEIDPARTAELGELLDDGADIDPVDLVRTKDGDLIPWDGWHRIDVHLSRGMETIRARVRPGTLEDAIELAAGANAKGPMPRCDETKRNAIRALLALPKYANAPLVEIQKAAGVSYQFARRTIDALTAAALVSSPAGVNGHAPDPLADNLRARAESPTRTVTTKDGRTYETSAKLNRKPKAEPEPPANGEDSRETSPPPAGVNGHAPPAPKAPPTLTDEESDLVFSCPLSSDLNGEQLAGFRAEVVFYARTAEARKSYGDMVRRHAPPLRPGGEPGHYQYRTDTYLRIPHPRDWKLCLQCKGKGCTRGEGCRGKGWVIG